jgi:Kef-type K+ transport system membrane component KefB
MTGGTQGQALGASSVTATNEAVTIVPRRRGVNTRHVVLRLTAVLIADIGLTPLLEVMIASSVTEDGSMSLSYYQTLLSSGRAWRLPGYSLK